MTYLFEILATWVSLGWVSAMFHELIIGLPLCLWASHLHCHCRWGVCCLPLKHFSSFSFRLLSWFYPRIAFMTVLLFFIKFLNSVHIFILDVDSFILLDLYSFWDVLDLWIRVPSALFPENKNKYLVFKGSKITLPWDLGPMSRSCSLWINHYTSPLFHCMRFDFHFCLQSSHLLYLNQLQFSSRFFLLTFFAVWLLLLRYFHFFCKVWFQKFACSFWNHGFLNFLYLCEWIIYIFEHKTHSVTWFFP